MTIQANFPIVRPSLLLDFANSKVLDPRISFTRSTTATYYDGVTQALAEQNLLLQSNSFSTSPWAATTATLAGSVSDPFGGTTAFSMTATAGNATLYQSYTATGLVQSFSIYIQRVTGTGTINITANGATGLTAQTISGTWTRYTVTATPSAGAVSIGIQLVTSGDAVNIYGAVLEQRATPIAFLPNYLITTTAPISNYIPQLLTAAINQPRFDVDPVTGLSKGLLIEDSNTNYLTYSQDFTQSIYTKTNVTALANQNIAPDGTLTANTLTETTATGYHLVSFVSSWSAYIMVKANGCNFVGWGNSATPAGVLNLTTGVITGSTSNITVQSIGNGWYIFSNWFRTGTSALQMSRDGTTWSYTGDGKSGIFVWGATDAGYIANLPSYIRTSGATVTKAADVVSMTGTNFSSWFNNGQGTFFTENYYDRNFTAISAPLNLYQVDAGVNATTNVIKAYCPSSSFNVTGLITNNGTNIYNQTLGAVSSGYNQATPASSLYKTALSYSNTSTSGQLNGATALTTTPTAIPPAMSRMTIGSQYGTVTTFINGWIKKLAYYPEQTTVAQITGLTSS